MALLIVKVSDPCPNHLLNHVLNPSVLMPYASCPLHPSIDCSPLTLNGDGHAMLCGPCAPLEPRPNPPLPFKPQPQ